MNIAILGAGNVGGALGKGWAAKGHSIYYGVPDPLDEKVRALLNSLGKNARAGSVHDAAENAEVVVLATPWPATRDAVLAAGKLAGKVVIDCVNPLQPDLSGLTVGHDTSAGEQVAQWAAGARVVKAFNTTGAGNMANTHYGDSEITMCVAGDDAAAKSTVMKLAQDLGFEAVDAGPLKNARLLESFAMLWIYLAVKQGLGPNIAFKLLRR
ncbi:MAG TPA: NADPH-dependent F420 reductase [Candidatus Acidoferrales bacterium]|nr:NADPH-dependent F420 reductase [Candidatus Acidoferrales bacterium]